MLGTPPATAPEHTTQHSEPPQPGGASEAVRRHVCRALGSRALAAAPTTHHDKWLHDSGPPPATPALPCGSFWSLVNNIKVMHQYAELISEAARGSGAHAPALHGGVEACASGLEWMAPLLLPARDALSGPQAAEYQQHLDLWRASHPGLYGYAEAAFHVHQSYAVEDRSMTRIIISHLAPEAREYEVSIAASLLRARPASFEAFRSQLEGWRARGVYHALALAAHHMPSAEQWAPQDAMHEAEDWQALLDEFNARGSLVSRARLTDFCDRLADRSPVFCNHVMGLLDRVAVLMRIKSNDDGGSGGATLDSLLPALCFDSPKCDEAHFPYTHTLGQWSRLKHMLEVAMPPALLCPSLCSSNRDGWGYPKLELGLEGDRLMVCTGGLQWMRKGHYATVELGVGLSDDRLQDILLRMGECATSPEVAHLMLDPASLDGYLAGRAPLCDTRLLTDRRAVLRAMGARGPAHPQTTGCAFADCMRRLIERLPPVRPQTFPAPLSVMAWRIDCPSRALLFNGSAADVDAERPDSLEPHYLHKLLLPDKMPCRTLSGVSVLSDTADSHTSLRACVAKEVLALYDDFADHPFHRVTVGGPTTPFSRRQYRARRAESAVEYTTTTLAESVALLTGPIPEKHSQVALHSSAPWDSEHIDNRYAETQLADNGRRYRDWVSMYRTLDEIHRSRLASHHVGVTQLFNTHFPLMMQDGGHAWVSVASTLPAELRVLRHLGGKTRLEALKRSVKNRFMNDSKLLPTWERDDTIDPLDVEIYSDQAAGQVLIAYAPRAAGGERKRLELISFRLCEAGISAVS